MKILLLAAMAAVIVSLLAGCANMEIPGITKPEPDIRWANVFRSSSSAAVQTNRVEFWMTEFACYRTVGTQKLYLDFQYERAEAAGDGGKAIYVLSSWSNEALAQGYTYYVLVGIGAYVYDYDAAETRSSREVEIGARIAATRQQEYGRALTEAEMAKVSELAELIAEEQDRQAALPQGKRFKPTHVDLRPEATRDSTPTTDAYDAGLWECLPDGTSHQIL